MSLNIKKLEDGCTYFAFAEDKEDQFQGAVDPKNSAYPVFWYVRAMLSVRMFLDDPKRILVLGLGAGALTRYVRKAYPDAHIISVDINWELLDLCCHPQSVFCIHDSPTNEVVKDDAVNYIMNYNGSKFDLILLDVFGSACDDAVLFSRLYSGSTLTKLKNMLTPTGVMSVNLESHKNSIKKLLDYWFDWRTMKFTQMYMTNQVYLCFAGNSRGIPVDLLRLRADTLHSDDPEFGFITFAKGFIRCNRVSDGVLLYDRAGK